MEDPFAALLNSLQSIFHLEAMRNGKYVYPPVQQLKDATEQYNPNSKYTFITLLRSVKEALPYIEKWKINFDVIRTSMDAMAKSHQLPTINWGIVLSHPKVSPRFQFSALNNSQKEDNLKTLLTTRTGKTFDQLNEDELTQALLDYRERHGFTQKLNDHLKQDPDFLFKLIISSEKNFIKISHSRLILYLTDQQIAQAMNKHSPTLVHAHKNPFDQVEELVHRLNGILSNGRSVDTILRNKDAKSILEHSTFFKIYLSEDFKNRNETAAPQAKGPS